MTDRTLWPEAKFWQRVDKGQPDDCWPWTGSHNFYGYGEFWAPGRLRVKAHRYSWELAHGQEPEGVIDHTCHNADADCDLGNRCPHRGCVNPAHLVDASSHSNQLASRFTLARINTEKTHCPANHEYTEENTGRWGKERKRHCRTCQNERRRVPR